MLYGTRGPVKSLCYHIACWPPERRCLVNGSASFFVAGKLCILQQQSLYQPQWMEAHSVEPRLDQNPCHSWLFHLCSSFAKLGDWCPLAKIPVNLIIFCSVSSMMDHLWQEFSCITCFFFPILCVSHRPIYIPHPPKNHFSESSFFSPSKPLINPHSFITAHEPTYILISSYFSSTYMGTVQTYTHWKDFSSTLSFRPTLTLVCRTANWFLTNIQNQPIYDLSSAFTSFMSHS